jgi:hypothetical protein
VGIVLLLYQRLESGDLGVVFLPDVFQLLAMLVDSIFLACLQCGNLCGVGIVALLQQLLKSGDLCGVCSVALLQLGSQAFNLSCLILNSLL